METEMHKAGFFRSILVAGVLTSFLITAGPALAKKPEWADNDKGGKHHSGGGYEKQRGDDRDRGGHRESYRSDHGDRRSHRHFSDQHQVVINNYYVNHWKSGPCPPGLAKKRNGCVPPGHAKKWGYGRPLPRDVIYYDLPPAVLVQLGPPPTGHKFVRVAQDILMIAVGTGLVVDGIEDIGRVID
jgi:Ni/Co efflux regulator RcnB